MCPTPGEHSGGSDPSEGTTGESAPQAPPAPAAPASGVARRDFEVIDARRVERADLVRDVLRRRRQDAVAQARPEGETDAVEAADAAQPEAAPVDDADTVQLRRGPDGQILAADGVGRAAAAAAAERSRRGVGAPSPLPHVREVPVALTGEAPSTSPTAALVRQTLSRRLGEAEGSRGGHEPSAPVPESGTEREAEPEREPQAQRAPEPDTNDTVQLSRGPLTRRAAAHAADTNDAPDTNDTVQLSRDLLERRGQSSEVPHDPAPPTAAIPIASAPPAPETSPSDVASAALGILRSWRADAEARAVAVAEAQLQARTERGRDALDPTGDLRRAVEAPGGREFLRELLDNVIRPDDHIVAGHGLGDLSDRIPPTLSQRARRAFKIGVVAGPGVPWIAVPLLRRTARAFFDREIVLDVPESRDRAAARAAELRAIPRAAPLGDPVIGPARATERIRRLAELVGDPGFPEVEFTLADVEPVRNLWDLEGTVERIAARLAPLYLAALGGDHGKPTFLSLRATGSDDLELTVRVFMRLLDEPALRGLHAGISLPAEFPESTGYLRRLAGWAHMRREDLGAPITLGITRAGDIPRERVDAVMHGWRLASFPEERDVDASVVRLLDQALHADHAAAMRIEIDGEVLRDAALAIALAGARRGGTLMRVVVPLGMGDATIERLRAAGAQPVRRLPLVPGDSMRPAVPYLLRRVDQEADAAQRRELSEAMLAGRDPMHPDDERLLDAVARMFQLPGGANRRQARVDADDAATVTASIQLDLFPEGLLDDDTALPLAAIPALDAGADGSGGASGGDDTGDALIPPGAHDAQRAPAPDDAADPLPTENPADTGPSARLTEIVLGLRRGRYLRNTFRSDPATDPTVPENRQWAARIQRRIGRSVIGNEEALALRVTEPEAIDLAVERASGAAAAWGAKPGWERAAHLERIAKAIEANRARVVEVAVSESGVPLADADTDVSRIIDVANHAAHLARQLDRMQGAAFHPVGVTVVVPPSSPPVSGALVSALLALAAGSAIVIKGSPRMRRTAAVLAGVLWDAEMPRELVQLLIIDDNPSIDESLSRRLITDDRVERVLLHGTWDTARTLLRWRPDLPIIAGTNGKNSIIVTPAADLDQAARDVARSAFLSTGQRAGHASTVILVGSVARSTRFLQQLADAVTAIAFGYPSDAGATAGPLLQPADAQLRFALTQLGEGERWLVEPRQLDDTGRLWTPGVRLGVQPGSYAHVTEFFGPVLSVMHALTFGEAIELQNATQYGLAAGLQSHDRAEIGRWIHEVQAGNLFVNRDTLGNAVQRNPLGGWRRSAVGPHHKMGGPNGLMSLGEWRIDPGQASPTLHLRGMDEKAVRLIEAAQPSLDYAAFDRVRRTVLSCQIAWNEEFGEVSDVTNLAFERNLFRYLPAAVTVRLAEGAPLEELVAVLAGARIVRAVPDVSVPSPLPDSVLASLDELQFAVRVESDAEFAARVREHGPDSLRIRLIGGSRRELCEALGGDPDVAVWSGPVTFAGHVELLPFLREQSISITAHRDGRPDARVASLFEHERVLDPERPFG